MPLKTVVGKTFKNLVLQSDNDVFIKFYAPWCGHCKKLAPLWDKIAEELKSVPGLVIANFDATANEVEGLNVRGYPTMRLYKKGEKNAPVDFDGERDIEGMKQWLKSKSSAYKRYLESKGEL